MFSELPSRMARCVLCREVDCVALSIYHSTAQQFTLSLLRLSVETGLGNTSPSLQSYCCAYSFVILGKCVVYFALVDKKQIH